MYLKKDKVKKKKLNIFDKLIKIYFFFTLFLGIIILTIILDSNFWKINKAIFINKFYNSGINNYAKVVEILFKSLPARLNPKLKEVSININQNNILILEKNRQDILNEIIVGSGDERFNSVDATLNFDKKEYDISIRLKGDRIQNFIDKDKVSYKIKITEDESFLKMRKFSLMKPRIRNYIHEWLFHEFSGTQKLTKLKYEFIYLNVNGSNNGLYVIEENFDTWLIERNKSRYGPIFSMREEFDENFMTSEFEIYNKNYWNKNENLELASQALKKLKMFQNNKISLEKTFDIDKWAKYFAVIDLTYSYHGSSPRNVKFFYNPITALFEPIPYDGHRIHVNYNDNISNYDHTTLFEKSKSGMYPSRIYNTDQFGIAEDTETSLIRAFFYDENGEVNKSFVKKYLSSINVVTNKDFLNNFFKKRDTDIQKINSAIYADYFLIDNNFNNKYGPGFYYFSKEDIYKRAEILKNKIRPDLSKINIKADQNNIYIFNNSYLNLRLDTEVFSCEKDDIYSKEDKKIFYKLPLDLNIKQVINKKKFNNIDKCNFVYFSNLEKTETYSKKIDFYLDASIKEENNEFLDFFDIDQNILTLKSNEILIKKDIVIPKKYIVKISSGQKIKLINNSLILSYSPWIALGKNSSIEISGDEKNFGGGIFIINQKKKSKFENVIFQYLAGVENRKFYDPNLIENKFLITYYNISKKNNYGKRLKIMDNQNYLVANSFKLTGALTIFGGEVKINNCQFIKISSEDALNIISASSKLTNLVFNENSSDSIDIDFGNSIIKNSNFSNIKGDGIDVSGSYIEIENIKFENIYDKAISVGEESSTLIKNVDGKNAFIGIAVKDGSNSKISSITFENIKFPFASYQKKKFYTNPKLELQNDIKINDYERKFLKDKSGIIKQGDKQVEEYFDDILNLVYKRVENTSLTIK